MWATQATTVRHAVRIHPLPLSLLCGLLLAARSAGALLTFWFKGVITRADAAQVDPLFQVGTRFGGSYTVETTTPGIPATTDTSFNFHYRDCVASWIVAVQGLADPWGGTSGQISIGDNAPFAGVTDRYAVTLFPDPASAVVFANGRPFRFFQIDMADYQPSGGYFEPVGDMLHSSALADALPDPALAMRPAAAFQDTAGNKAGGVITFIAIPECRFTGTGQPRHRVEDPAGGQRPHALGERELVLSGVDDAQVVEFQGGQRVAHRRSAFPLARPRGTGGNPLALWPGRLQNAPQNGIGSTIFRPSCRVFFSARPAWDGQDVVDARAVPGRAAGGPVGPGDLARTGGAA